MENNTKDRSSATKKGLTPLHKYQVSVVFLFALGYALFIPYSYFIEKHLLDQQVYAWYALFPWMALYITYCLRLRSKIPEKDQTKPQKRHIFYWVALGIAIVALNTSQQIPEQRIYSAFNASFIVFSLFLADSYWDFNEIIKRRKK